MNSLLTDENGLYLAGFWQRQFSSFRTPYQIVFDVVFGILMPFICFYLDPGIILDGPLLSYAFLIYSLSTIAMITLTVWLAFAPRNKVAGAIIAGILASGAVCSFSIGIAILPLTLIGLFLIIGILGLVPFLTGFVYLRNLTRAILPAHANLGGPALVGALSVGLLIGAGFPLIGEFRISDIVARSMNQILVQQDPQSNEEALKQLKYFAWRTDMDRLVREYEDEPNQERKDNLAKAYKEITGEEIEDRLSTLND